MMKILKKVLLVSPLLLMSHTSAFAESSIAMSPWSPNALYEWDDLANKKSIYIDRYYLFSGLPSKFTGMEYLRTSNDDKESDGTVSNYLTFNISEKATVYVVHDQRVSPRPSWLSSWTDTGIDISAAGTTYNVYSKAFAAGKVQIGGNGGNPNSNMYSVFLDPGASSSTGSTTTTSSGSTSGTLTAANDTASTAINRSVAINVLANDSGLANTPIDVSIVTSTQNGWVTKQSDNKVLFSPKWNFTGTDSFTYRIKDSKGAVATAKGTITVSTSGSTTSTNTGSTSGSGSSSGSASGTTLTISWSHADADTVDGYNLYSGPSAWSVDNHVATVTSGNMANPSVTVDLASDLGTSEGEKVCFKTRAYNAYGVSLPSQAACIVP